MITNCVSVQSKPIFHSQKRDKNRLSFQRPILPLKILFVENNLSLKKEKKKKMTKYRAIIFDASMSAEERVFPKREKKSSKRN